MPANFQNISTTGPRYDVAGDPDHVEFHRDKLPMESLATLEELESDLKASELFHEHRLRESEDLRRQRDELANSVQHRKLSMNYGTKFAERDLEKLNRDVSKLESLAAKLREIQGRKAPRFFPPAKVYSLLAAAPRHARFEYFAPEVKSKNPVSDLEKERAHQKALHAERDAVLEGPLPLAVQQQRLRDDLDRMARRGRISTAGIRNPRQTAGARWVQGHLNFPAVIVDGKEIHDASAIIVWLFHDELLAKLDADLQERADPDATPLNERAAKVQEIDDALMMSERREEVLLRLARDAGAKVERRNNANVLAVLQIVRGADAEPEPIKEVEHPIVGPDSMLTVN